MGASEMAVRTPASAQTAQAPTHAQPQTPSAWITEPQPDAESYPAARPTECRAERWATWVLIYLAALTTSLAIGASVWALGLTG
jgi:hypothetical protein